MANDYCNYDTDFGGDDLKLVEYDVVFDEYCKEAWVGRGRTLINYATTAEAFASTALADFRVLLDKKKGCAEIIDPCWSKERIDEIMSEQARCEDDEEWKHNRHRYLYCRSPRIVDRWPRRERDCDDDQVSMLRRINKTLERLVPVS
jgi:hypothetical protein